MNKFQLFFPFYVKIVRTNYHKFSAIFEQERDQIEYPVVIENLQRIKIEPYIKFNGV